MSDSEFEQGLAEAAAGEGELFQDTPAGSFRPATVEEFLTDES